ncbi:hypothetical protein Tco_1472747 [Tanacetum coccineum]
MSTMAENVIVARADNCPSLLEKSQYNSWQSRMKLYIRGKEHGKDLLDPVLHGLFKYGTVQFPGTPTTAEYTRDRTYEDLTDKEKILAKEIWDRVKILIEGTELSLQERESKLYNEFDRFTSEKGETIHLYYLRFSKLINDINTIGMTMHKLQVNTNFVNNLQSEWSKFVTDVKLTKNMHESSFDQLYAYLRQHEVHANEVYMMREWFPDPLSLVVNT